MYERTCKILPWLKACGSLPESLSEHFDVIPTVQSFEGISFSPHLNFLAGESGSGRTRLLERLKQACGLPLLPTTRPLLMESLSPGQMVFGVGLRLLEAMPPDDALLCDDLFHMLDDAHLAEFFQKVSSSGKQAIVTVTPREMTRVEKLVRQASSIDFKIVRLPDES